MTQGTIHCKGSTSRKPWVPPSSLLGRMSASQKVGRCLGEAGETEIHGGEAYHTVPAGQGRLGGSWKPH